MCAQSATRQFPYYASTMVGRESETELLQRFIQDPNVQLITVAGTGGVGKTRLTAFVARKMEHLGSDGVLFVSLATIREPELVPAEIGKALDLQSDDLIDAIRTRLGAWQGILLLDNLEQVIQSAPDIARILPHNPDLTVIVTSQRPLQIDGERVVRLDPLEVPPPEADAAMLRSSPSVRLLIDRASDQDASFAESIREASTAEAIAEICRRLDGIPLAIELAASRLASLSPEVVLAQLEQGQHILSTQRRDAPERQRTMHAAISWSFHLLPDDSKRIFLWLGAFTAGFDLDIVDRVSQHLGLSTPAVDTVSELINLSLLRRVSSGANPWYTMLESMREFCLAELDETGDRQAAQGFIADHVVDLANSTEEMLTSSAIGEWKAMLDRQLPTVRTVVSWALAHEDPQVPFLVAAGMWRYLEQEGRWQEGATWVEQAGAWKHKLPDDILLAGLIAKMTMLEDGRDIPGAMATSAEVRDLLRDKDYPDLRVQYLLRSGSLAQDQQKLDDALANFSEAAELAEKHGIVRNLAVSRANIGIIAYLRGDFVGAEANFLKVKDSLSQLGDMTGMANILSNLAATATLQEEPLRALDYLDQATVIIQQLGLKRDLVYTLLNQASALIALGELDAAANASEEAISLAQDLNFRILIATGYVNLSEVYLRKGKSSSSAAMMLRSLDEITPEEGSRHLVEIGLLLSDALASTSRYGDAAAMLAKAKAFAAEIEFTFDPQHRERLDRVACVIDENLENPAAAQSKGESWTTETYIRNLHWFARRLSSVPTGILITVPAAPAEIEAESGLFADLTPRESEILHLLTEGHSTRSLADHLSVSPRTVTTHIANMMAKLEVSSRTELVAKAMRERQ